jgi:RHS repeat-associated protein
MELKDHLGNVSTVLTDRKKATPAVDELPRTYDADVLSYADYYPFGMEIAHRTESKEHEIDYQYGYVEVTDFDNPIYKRQLISDDGGVGDPYTFDHHFGTHATWTVGPNGVYNKYNPLGWGYMLNPSIDPDYISHCYFARGAYPSEPFLIQGSRDPNNNDNDCCNLSYASSSTVVPPHIVVESNSDPAETSLKFTGYTANPIVSLLFFNRVRGMIKLGKNYELGGVNMPSNLRGKGIPEGAYETDISFSIASYDIKPGSLKIYVTDAQGNHYVDPAIISVIENNQTSYNEGDIWHAVNMSVHLLNVDPDLGYRLVIEFDPQNNFSFYPSYVKIKQLKYDIKLFEGYGTKIVNRGTYQTAENTGYRYGFNGQERTDELKGAGNHYTAQFWEYDPRLGRRWNIDPVVKHDQSGFSALANNPIWFIDPTGADTHFVNKADRDFVLQFVDKKNKNYDRRFARKFKRLVKSDKTYHFEGVAAGDPKLQAGKTFADPNDPNYIFVAFTKGDSRMNLIATNGFSKYKALWEETYHAWDHDKGRLNLNESSAMDEARAWKFSMLAPGTKYKYINYIGGKGYEDYTAAFRLRYGSKLQVARWLKYGMEPYFDEATQQGYGGFGRKDEEGNTIGLYHDRPLK